ncbi:MAG: hypothetical protein WBM50_26980 [Acidimicrobiales bacterium]
MTMDGLWPRYLLDDRLGALLDGIGDELRACEDEAESGRRLPASAVTTMRGLNLFAMSSPEAVGGWEAPPLLEMEVFETVARFNSSAGWNLFVGSVHSAFPAAFLGDGAIAEMYRDGGIPIVAGQMQPVGSARPEPGGMRVSGRYSWGSGISHADYVLGGAVLEGGPGPGAGFRVFVGPKEAVEVLDNWHVVGVSGSGSYDYAVDDVFVPEGWWFDYPEPVVRRGGGKYAVSIQAQIGSAHIGFALGLGRRALEEIASLAVAKQRTGAKGSIAVSEVFRRGLGVSYLELMSARERAAAVLGRLGTLQQAGEVVDELFVAEVRAVATYVTEVALSVATNGIRHAGGTAIRLDNPLQRLVRELLVAQAHMFVTDANYAALGRVILDRTEPSKPTGTFAAPKPLQPIERPGPPGGHGWR